MYPTLSVTVVPDKEIAEVDILKDNYLLDVGSAFMAIPANDAKIAIVTVVPNNSRSTFGFRQPRVKPSQNPNGNRVSVAIFSPYESTTLFLGTSLGFGSFWELPPNGLKGDLNKPLSEIDFKEEIKCATFHPIAKNLIAVGLRNGHVQLFDKSLKGPLADFVHTRPLNSLAFSDDGLLLFALYVDMTMKTWDVRSVKELTEVKIGTSRGVGYLTAISGRRVIVSFSAGNKQELRLYDHTGQQLSVRQFGLSGTPLSICAHFTDLVLAVASREPKLYVLDGNTLADVATYQHTGPILAAGYERVRPDPDSSVITTVSLLNNNNSISRVQLDVGTAPATYANLCPTYATSLEGAAWLKGEDGEPPFERLTPSVKQEVVAVAEEKVVAAPRTYYKFMAGIGDPPSKYWINLPVNQAPCPEFNEVVTNGTDFAFIGVGNTPPIVIMPLDKPQRYLPEWPQIIYDPHGSAVGTLLFSPHNPRLLVSGGEDCRAKLWEIPSPFNEPIRQPLCALNHNRRVSIAKFSQSVQNLLLTATASPELNFWDLNTQQRIRSFGDMLETIPIQDCDLHECCSAVYTILRDGNLLALDPRAENPEIAKVLAQKNGGRHRRLLNIPDFGYIATFGTSDLGERQVVIWDRKQLTKPLKSLSLDTATGAMMPMYEEGAGVIYLGGKGDGHVRFIEVCQDDRVIASSGVYETSDPERGLCLLPRKQCDVMGCECSRMIKLGIESMQILHWKVPRAFTDLFHDEIFAPVRDTSHPIMDIAEWQSGHEAQFPLIDFQPPGTKKFSEHAPVAARRAGGGKIATGGDHKAQPKPLSIDEIVAMAPALSDSESESDETDSW
jgi:WD40 repeat protein